MKKKSHYCWSFSEVMSSTIMALLKELLKGIHIIARLFNRFKRHINGDFIYEDSIYSITPFSLKNLP